MHLTIALPLVVFEVALVDVATLPVEFAIAILLISLVFSFEAILDTETSLGIFWLFAPFAFAMLHSIEELTCVGVPIRPFVLAKAIRIAVAILPNVLISI
jgi:hypothetical protein